MAVFAPLVSQYAINIVLTGKQRFTQRDGCTGIPASYADLVEGHAAQNFYLDDLDAALANGWLLQAEYDGIVARKGPADPAYRPRNAQP